MKIRHNIQLFSDGNRQFVSSFLFLSFGICLSINAQEINFHDTSLKVLEYDAEKNTGLDKIYVAYNLNNANIEYKSVNPSQVKWYRFSNLGGGFAEEIVNNIEITADGSSLYKPEGDMGYIIEENDTRYFFWIVEYETKRLNLRSLKLSSDQECGYTKLDVDGEGSAIHYFTINGQQRTLSRDLSLEYETEEWDETDKEFKKINQTKILDDINTIIQFAPPAYCSTFFTLKGDRFLEAWNWEESVESDVYQPTSIAIRTEAIQEKEEDEKSNQIKVETEGLGGSAPADIRFKSYGTEGVLHSEWQLSKDKEFNDIEYRFSVSDMDYTFTEEGTYYIRYIGSNYNGSCEEVSDTYTVSIGASELLCPNAFTPDGDGINDEWKVSYRSLLDFKCWIYDRAGHQMAYLTSPEQGWDGKYKGKTVSTGAYYYVIQATGSDGKKYKLNGDINILRHKKPAPNVIE